MTERGVLLCNLSLQVECTALVYLDIHAARFSLTAVSGIEFSTLLTFV